jgi:uncharacterized membrane protein YjgN (DUF898 family)
MLNRKEQPVASSLWFAFKRPWIVAKGLLAWLVAVVNVRSSNEGRENRFNRFHVSFMLCLLLVTYEEGRSQWPCSLRHELFSLALTLGSWVRFPLRKWMFGVCMRLFCVCVVLYVGSGLATGWSLVHGVLPSVKNDYWTEKEAWGLNGLEEPPKKNVWERIGTEER